MAALIQADRVELHSSSPWTRVWSLFYRVARTRRFATASIRAAAIMRVPGMSLCFLVGRWCSHNPARALSHPQIVLRKQLTPQKR